MVTTPFLMRLKTEKIRPITIAIAKWWPYHIKHLETNDLHYREYADKLHVTSQLITKVVADLKGTFSYKQLKRCHLRTDKDNATNICHLNESVKRMDK